jgi:hypothetical protein
LIPLIKSIHHANHQYVLRNFGVDVLSRQRQHHTPHIHVRYQGSEAVIAIPEGELLSGSMPVKQFKLVQAWIAIHSEELMVDWELAVQGDEPFRIAPLQ